MSWINSYLLYLSYHKTDVVFIILLTTCTGSLCTAFLLLIEKFIGFRSARIVKAGVRINMVTFVVPIVYFLVLFRRMGTTFDPEYYADNIFKMTGGMWFIVRFLLIIWAAAAFFQVADLIRSHISLYLKRKGDVPAEYGMPETMAMLLKKYGIKKKIGIYQNDKISMPALGGLFKPVLIFPYRSYSHEEQVIAITHELMHYNNHDHIRRLLMELVVILNAWNPMVYQLRRIHNVINEYACDERSIQVGEIFYTSKEYFNMIVEDTIKMNEPPTMIMSPFGEEPGEIEGRVQYMLKKENQKKIKKYVLGLAVSFAMLGSSFASYAMGEGLAGGQELLYRHMADWEETKGLNNETEVFTMTAEDIANDGVEEVIMEENSLTRAVKIINWDIAKNLRVVSSEEMYLTAGSVVGFNVGITPSDKTIMVGIKSRYDSITYCNVSGTATREITVSESGYYRFCIQNDNSVAVNVAGSYTY